MRTHALAYTMHHTNYFFNLRPACSQVHGHAGSKEQSALYCAATLQRQLASGEQLVCAVYTQGAATLQRHLASGKQLVCAECTHTFHVCAGSPISSQLYLLAFLFQGSGRVHYMAPMARAFTRSLLHSLA